MSKVWQFTKLASGPVLIALAICGMLIVHDTIQALVPYYTGTTQWATAFWQEHLRLWEFRGMVACVLTFLLGAHIISRRYK